MSSFGTFDALERAFQEAKKKTEEAPIAPSSTPTEPPMQKADETNSVDQLANELLHARAQYEAAKDALKRIENEVVSKAGLPNLTGDASEEFDGKHQVEIVGSRANIRITASARIRWDQNALREIFDPVGRDVPDYVRTNLSIPASVYRALDPAEKELLDPAAEPYLGKPTLEVLLHV